MDKLAKATQMARIKLMLKIKNQSSQKEKLTQLALELILAGTDQSQIVQVLVIREGLSASEKVVLQEVMAQF